MNNLCILYYFSRENPEVIDRFCSDAVVYGDDALSGIERGGRGVGGVPVPT